jgi:hypothetical protein
MVFHEGYSGDWMVSFWGGANVIEQAWHTEVLNSIG